MSKWILVLILAIMAGCDLRSSGQWSEIEAGETVELFPCGPWERPQLDVFPRVVADYNARIRHEEGESFEGGRPLYVLGEHKEGLLYRGEGTTSLRCAYWIWGPEEGKEGEEYPTPEGRELWKKHFSFPINGRNVWLGGLNDGRAIFIFRRKDVCPGDQGVFPACWDPTGVLAHEMGHGVIGSYHLPDPAGDPTLRAVMTQPNSTNVLTTLDVDEFCQHLECVKGTVEIPLAGSVTPMPASEGFSCLSE